MVHIAAHDRNNYAYSGPSQKSRMNLFAKIINDIQQKALD